MTETVAEKTSELNIGWVAVACVLLFLMQAGLMFLEVGFSRRKNAGTGVARILVNFALCTIAWWAVGYGIAEGGGNELFGVSGFFLHFDQTVAGELVTGETAMLMLYGLVFCAVSPAIVWGTTLERIKFGALPRSRRRSGSAPASPARRCCSSMTERRRPPEGPARPRGRLASLPWTSTSP